MVHLLTFVGGLAAGYALSIYTWPAVQTRLMDTEATVTSLWGRLIAWLQRARDVFGRGG